LKQRLCGVHRIGRGRVAPHAGAWIETLIPEHKCYCEVLSPPTRGRGLKPVALW